MLRPILFALVLHLAACASRSPSSAVPEGVDLAVTNVHILPMDAERVLRDRSVLVEGDRIVAVVGSDVRVPSHVRIIDGQGRYLIPGLWDMHVHALADAERFFPLFLAHGVTGVRDMGSHLSDLSQVRQRLGERNMIGPSLIGAGPILDGPRHRWTHSIAWPLETAGEARAAVDSLARAGVDFLKVYSGVSAEVYAEIVRAARGHGLPFAGHVPFDVDADEASRLGQASFEHAELHVTTLPCLERGGARMRELLNVWTTEGYEAYLAGIERLRSERRPGCVADLYRTYAANGTWVTPTIVNSVKDSGSVNWPAIESLYSSDRQASCRGTVALFEQASDGARARYHRGVLEDIRMMHDAGISLLAGTDVPNPCVVPGASLHDELEWLVKAGLPPYEALRTATVNPAEFLRARDTLGMIAPGYIADMVLLGGNPLSDVSNIRDVLLVVRRGQPFDSTQIAGLLGFQ